METKFAEFIKKQKIDPRRIRTASRQIERLRPEDRAVKLKKRQGKKAEGGDKEEAPAKPRSGRVVTRRLLQVASTGGSVSGAAKTRLLRAINRVLEQKKQQPVELKALF